MSGKSFCLASMVAAVLGLGTARGQGMSYGTPGAAPGAAPTAETVPAAPPGSGSPTLSRWITYDKQPGCCGPTGRQGPIGYEIYLRSGVSVPVEGSGLGGALDNGWMISGGARTLFFNAEADAAWTIDVGLANVYNRVGNRTRPFQLNNVGPNQLFAVPNTNPPIILGNQNPIVTGSDLNRTYGTIAVGREWYLWGSAEQDGCNRNWRVGVDVGGTYGTEKLDLNETRHLTDTIGGFFVSVHTDLEIPCGQCLFLAGVRAEYGCTFSDILQHQNDADVQDINLLLSIGLRF